MEPKIEEVHFRQACTQVEVWPTMTLARPRNCPDPSGFARALTGLGPATSTIHQGTQEDPRLPLHWVTACRLWSLLQILPQPCNLAPGPLSCGPRALSQPRDPRGDTPICAPGRRSADLRQNRGPETTLYFSTILSLPWQRSCSAFPALWQETFLLVTPEADLQTLDLAIDLKAAL